MHSPTQRLIYEENPICCCWNNRLPYVLQFVLLHALFLVFVEFFEGNCRVLNLCQGSAGGVLLNILCALWLEGRLGCSNLKPVSVRASLCCRAKESCQTHLTLSGVKQLIRNTVKFSYSFQTSYISHSLHQFTYPRFTHPRFRTRQCLCSSWLLRLK